MKAPRVISLYSPYVVLILLWLAPRLDAALARPFNVHASDGVHRDRIEVEWNSVANADRYDIWRNTTGNENALIKIKGNVGATKFIDYDVDTGVRYWYWIDAKNRFGEVSPLSAADSGWRDGRPQAPTTVTATQGEFANRVRIAWERPLGADRYMVRRGMSESFANSAAIVSNLGAFSSSYDDFSAVLGVTYYYWVIAADDLAGSGTPSASATGWIRRLPLPPDDVTAISGLPGRISLSWSAVATALEYDVLRSESPDSAVATIIHNTSQRSFSDNLDTNETGIEFHYWIRATNAFGASVLSEPAVAWGDGRPAPPQQVTASVDTSHAGVILSWSVSPAAQQYRVYRSINNVSGGATALGITSETDVLDATAMSAVSYYYWVKAINAPYADSQFSGTVIGRRRGTPAAPTGISASTGTAFNHIQVQWSSTNTATSYELWRNTRTDLPTATLLADDISSTTYIDASAQPGVRYSFWVAASNSYGTSERAGPADGWRAGIPLTTTTISASDGASSARIRVSWQSTPGATAYDVYRSFEDSLSTSDLLSFAVPGASYDDTSALPNGRYYYRVRARNTSGVSLSFSASDSGWWTNSSMPASGLDVSKGDFFDAIRLEWVEDHDISEFRVLRGETNALESASVIADNLDSFQYRDTPAPATLYYYWLQMTSDTNAIVSTVGPESGWRAGIPRVPTGVQASDGSVAEAIRVRWEPTLLATTYRVWRNPTDEPDDRRVIASGVTTTEYLDTLISTNANYDYQVVAANAYGASDISAPDIGFATELILTATDGDPSVANVTLEWTSTVNASLFEVWRSRRPDRATATKIVELGAITSFQDSTAASGTLYYYWLKATVDNGTIINTFFSQPEAGWRAGVPTPPLELLVTKGAYAQDIEVRWSTAAADTYELWRAISTDPVQATRILSATNATSVIDAALSPGITYYYWTKAINEFGTSSFSSRESGYTGAPTPPLQVSASDGTEVTQVHVDWIAVPAALSYDIWRGPDSNAASSARIAADVESTSYDDPSAATGISFNYWVTTNTLFGASTFGANDNGWRNGLPPSNVVATAGTRSDAVQVTWTPTSDAISYDLWRGTSSAYGQAQFIATVSQPEFTDGTAARLTTQYYWVRNVYEAGLSAVPAPVSGWRNVPDPRAVVASDRTSTTAVTVQWQQEQSDQVTSYEIWRHSSDDVSLATRIGSSNSTTRTFTDHAPFEQLFNYWVRAVHPLGTSGFSLPDTGIRKGLPPSSVAAADGESSEQITISWPAVEEARSYRLWRNTQNDSAAASSTGDSLSQTVYIDSSIAPLTQYYYWVTATFQHGSSDFGAPDGGWRNVAPPSGVAAEDGIRADVVAISWNPVSGSTAYQVWRSPNDELSSAAPVQTVTDSAYHDDGVAPFQIHRYWVLAVHPLGVSDFGAADTGWRSGVPPAPAAVDASRGRFLNRIQVAWAPVFGADAYEVWRADPASGLDEMLATDVHNPLLVDTTAATGIVYRYRIRSLNRFGTGVFSTDALGSHVGTVACETGWNLISFPGEISQTVGGVLRDRSSDNPLFTMIWSWDWRQNRFRSVHESSVPEANTGFWLYSETGGQPLAYDVISDTGGTELQRGWNLVGPTAEALVSDISSIVAAWRWSAADRAYVLVSPAEQLLPGYAYWIYARSQVRINW